MASLALPRTLCTAFLGCLTRCVSNGDFFDRVLMFKSFLKPVVDFGSNFSKEWHNKVNFVLRDTSLNFNLNTQFQSKGKFGLHSEFMSKILSEMQSTARKFPGCKW